MDITTLSQIKKIKGDKRYAFFGDESFNDSKFVYTIVGIPIEYNKAISNDIKHSKKNPQALKLTRDYLQMFCDNSLFSVSFTYFGQAEEKVIKLLSSSYIKSLFNILVEYKIIAEYDNCYYDSFANCDDCLTLHKNINLKSAKSGTLLGLQISDLESYLVFRNEKLDNNFQIFLNKIPKNKKKKKTVTSMSECSTKLQALEEIRLAMVDSNSKFFKSKHRSYLILKMVKLHTELGIDTIIDIRKKIDAEIPKIFVKDFDRFGNFKTVHFIVLCDLLISSPNLENKKCNNHYSKVLLLSDIENLKRFYQENDKAN